MQQAANHGLAAILVRSARAESESVVNLAPLDLTYADLTYANHISHV
jgi:hypothetical protein